MMIFTVNLPEYHSLDIGTAKNNHLSAVKREIGKTSTKGKEPISVATWF